MTQDKEEAMTTPVEFMNRYRNLNVNVVIDDPVARMCRPATFRVELKKYFMMNWKHGSPQLANFDEVMKARKDDVWFQANQKRIRTAAEGNGAPEDYELALEWAVRSRKIATV